MIKSIAKLSSVAAATLLLAGCFSAQSINRAANGAADANAASPTKEYTLSGDFLFDFDKSNLSAQGKSTLDQVAQELKATNASRVTVTGYTDRLGSADYNLKLSQARANTAKNYLKAQGVTAEIDAVGRGKADQVIACNDQKGDALKSCLKPNRRVHIVAN